jgi:hypothetical protein
MHFSPNSRVDVLIRFKPTLLAGKVTHKHHSDRSGFMPAALHSSNCPITQRCGAAADEDQTFEGSALRGSGPTPSPSGTEPSCHPPGNFGFRRLVDVKRSEPHVRYRDATSPDPAVRRKPSRW